MTSGETRIRHRMIKLLVLAAGVMILFTGVAFGATSATITLKGTVAGILEITITPEAGHDSLDFASLQNGLLVATVTERSNLAAGYTVTIESANATSAGGGAQFFRSATNPNSNTDTLDYTMDYGGVAVILVNGRALVSDVSQKTPGAGFQKQLTISYDASMAFLTADAYQDTLTFTIAAK